MTNDVSLSPEIIHDLDPSRILLLRFPTNAGKILVAIQSMFCREIKKKVRSKIPRRHIVYSMD